MSNKAENIEEVADTFQIEAVYENGVFKPRQAVEKAVRVVGQDGVPHLRHVPALVEGQPVTLMIKAWPKYTLEEAAAKVKEWRAPPEELMTEEELAEFMKQLRPSACRDKTQG